MNATLLKVANNVQEDPVKRELFGSFKGFSLKPLPMSKPNIMGAANVAYVHPVAKAGSVNECLPSRVAPLPPPPAVTAITNSPKKSQFKSSPNLSPSSSYRYQNINATSKDSPETPIEVKLFATKSDAKERPKISNPVLENSTVSVKELIATANSTQPKVHTQKPSAPHASTMEKGAINKKNSIKKLDISAPIKSVTFGRSQSMRSPSSEKAPVKRNALASGSMRYPPGKRPKNPPPPRPSNAPPPPGNNNSNSSLRNIYANTNDDGDLSNANSSDNIYCVIEDVKESPPQNGLLSEIVNEIENRNGNSIYSTSKNQRKNTTNAIEPTTYENVGNAQNDNLYMNTADIVDEPASNSKPQIEIPKSNNVSAIAKKLAGTSTAFGNGGLKPTIATKPQTIANSKSSSASSKESNQTDSTKKPYTKPVYATAVGKPRSVGKATIAPTSTVRQMHQRFENNRNA